MNASEFVSCWRREKDELLRLFTDPSSQSAVAHKINSLNLSAEKQEITKEIVDEILTDSFFTLLLGLDGAANIGGIQASYALHDEHGNVVYSPGELEEEAYSQFYNSDT